MDDKKRKCSGDNDSDADSSMKKIKFHVSDITCPITRQIYNIPVIASDGFTYEKYGIDRHTERSNMSPMTSEVLTEGTFENKAMCKLVNDVLDKYPGYKEDQFDGEIYKDFLSNNKQALEYLMARRFDKISDYRNIVLTHEIRHRRTEHNYVYEYVFNYCSNDELLMKIIKKSVDLESRDDSDTKLLIDMFEMIIQKNRIIALEYIIDNYKNIHFDVSEIFVKYRHCNHLTFKYIRSKYEPLLNTYTIDLNTLFSNCCVSNTIMSSFLHSIIMKSADRIIFNLPLMKNIFNHCDVIEIEEYLQLLDSRLVNALEDNHSRRVIEMQLCSVGECNVWHLYSEIHMSRHLDPSEKSHILNIFIEIFTRRINIINIQEISHRSCEQEGVCIRTRGHTLAKITTEEDENTDENNENNSNSGDNDESDD